MTSNELLRSKKGGYREGGGHCHQDLLIYWTQWSIDLVDLLILNEWLNIGATFILYDLVFIMDLYICMFSLLFSSHSWARSLLFREVLLAGYIHCECAPFQGKEGGRVVGWLGGWVGNWGNWARGGEAAATHLCARQVGALSLWSRRAWHASSIEEAVAFTGEVRTRRATSLSTIYQGSWNKKRVPLLIVNFLRFTEKVWAWRLWWRPATPPANNAQVDE